MQIYIYSVYTCHSHMCDPCIMIYNRCDECMANETIIIYNNATIMYVTRTSIYTYAEIWCDDDTICTNAPSLKVCEYIYMYVCVSAIHRVRYSNYLREMYGSLSLHVYLYEWLRL